MLNFIFTVSEEEDNDVIVTRKPNQVNAYHIFMYRTVLIIKEKQSYIGNLIYNITEFNIQFLKSIISNDKHYTIDYYVFNQNKKKT